MYSYEDQEAGTVQNGFAQNGYAHNAYAGGPERAAPLRNRKKGISTLRLLLIGIAALLVTPLYVSFLARNAVESARKPRWSAPILNAALSLVRTLVGGQACMRLRSRATSSP